MTYANPQYLVETDWLAAHLSDPTIRIVDSSVVFLQSPDGPPRSLSGRPDYDAGHIPGAVFADMTRDFSDRANPLPFMMPTAEQFGAALGALGVGNDHRIICYDSGFGMWAARFWWMLRTFGHDRAAVLNGGLKKWRAEGRPLTTEPPSHPPTQFIARYDATRIADKAEVLRYVANGGACLINALSPAQFRGDHAAPGRRAGRIPTSVNVPAADGVIDPTTNTVRPADDLRRLFEAVGALDGQRVVTYCGGGIAACADALALTLLGVRDVAVYDGSMTEWSADPTLPMERG
ncbi:MAG: sulfurtransferase [Dehalococcoidia bacterium]|nr:sulfurtransferase [Dehalococcoidia bacterium]